MSNGEPAWIKNFILFFLSFTLFFSLIVFFFCRNSLAKTKEYLQYKRGQFATRIRVIDVHGIDGHVKREMGNKIYLLKRFFGPLIIRFVSIETTKEGSYEKLQKVNKVFSDAVRKSKNHYVRKIAPSLGEKLVDITLDAIKEKKEVIFDQDFFENFNFKEEEEKIYKRIENEQVLEKNQLWEVIKKIDGIIEQIKLKEEQN